MLPTKLNAEQQAVIDSNSNHIVINACAGSGKTFCLTTAVRKYIQEHPYDKVCAITFTRKAADELRSRILNSGHDLEVCTIHSWALKRLGELSEEYGFRIVLLEEEEIKPILQKLCNARSYFHLNPFQLYSYVMGNYNIDVEEAAKKRFEAIRCDYEKYKRARHLYDFTDLPLYLQDKLDEYEVVINNIDALFVDEFQDVDEIEFNVLQGVEAAHKFYIGDPRQSIYQFKGAVDNVLEKLDGFDVFELNMNYRSYQEILDYATTVRETAFDTYDSSPIVASNITYYDESNITCDRGSNESAVNVVENYDSSITLGTKTYFNNHIFVRDLILDPRTQILCRSNKQVKKIQSYGFNNVSTVHQAKGLEYDNVIVADFELKSEEEINICYVALTRAKNKLCVIPFQVLLQIIVSGNIQGKDALTKLF